MFSASARAPRETSTPRQAWACVMHVCFMPSWRSICVRLGDSIVQDVTSYMWRDHRPRRLRWRARRLCVRLFFYCRMLHT